MAGAYVMNRRGQRILFAGYASVCLSLGACSHDASTKDAYEVPEHICERQTLRQDPYAEPRPDNAPIDCNSRNSFPSSNPIHRQTLDKGSDINNKETCHEKITTRSQ